VSRPIRLLCVGGGLPGHGGSAWGPFTVLQSATLAVAAERLRTESTDAVLVHLADAAALEQLEAWPSLSHAVLDAAVIAVAPEIPLPLALRLLQRGLQDLVPAGSPPEWLARTVRLAVERKRLEQGARKAYATDLATGLPNHLQFLEHMTHLLALREREPAPMAVLALRVEGFAATEAALGAEAANVLRRKVAVRIRSALRASDVVASTGADTMAVLLAWIDAPQDGERVAAKLAQSLQRPFTVAGQPQQVAVSVGLARYPDHGKVAEELLRRAVGQASSSATLGRPGLAQRIERGPGGPAANDD
jgi:diguanylate cyclase (GGDEF)-like protein